MKAGLRLRAGPTAPESKNFPARAIASSTSSRYVQLVLSSSRQWLGFALCLSVRLSGAYAEDPQRVSACQVKANPAAFNHKIIEVTAFIYHGFEQFTLFDPACPEWPQISMEFGGATVEQVPTALVTDDRHREFARMIHSPPDRVVRATLVGRFFSGRQHPMRNGDVIWNGYGHLGCCSLLVIQQVLSVDPQSRTDLDYRASADHPGINKTGCGYRLLMPLEPAAELLAAQKHAEEGSAVGMPTDPLRIATGTLAKLLDVDRAAVSGLKQTRKSQGRVVYEWRPKGSRKAYLVVMSRPYWLSFYAKDPRRVAWVAIAAYESSCR